MKKLLLSALFLLIVSLISAKAFVSLFGYQTIETLKTTLESEASITYDWMSSDFSGQIHFHDVVITPFRLKQPYQVEKLSISYGNLPSLIFGLLDLKSGLWQGVDSISLTNVRIPLKEGGLINWLAKEYDTALLVPLHAYACLQDARLTADDWRAMGINEFKLDLNLSFNNDHSTLQTQAQINLYELGGLKLSIDTQSHSIAPALDQINLLNAAINQLEIDYIENGFFRRLGNYCSTKTNQTHATYANQAASEWRSAMAKIGFVLNHNLEAFYHDYLVTGGKMTLSLNPASPLLLASAESWLDRSLSKTLGLTLTLNDQPVVEPEIFLKGDYFRPAPVVVEKVPEKPKEIPKAFYPIEWDALVMQENQRVRIHLASNKVIEGVLEAKTDFKLSVLQSIEGGEFTVHPRKSDIQLIEIWR